MIYLVEHVFIEILPKILVRIPSSPIVNVFFVIGNVVIVIVTEQIDLNLNDDSYIGTSIVSVSRSAREKTINNLDLMDINNWYQPTLKKDEKVRSIKKDVDIIQITIELVRVV